MKFSPNDLLALQEALQQNAGTPQQQPPTYAAAMSPELTLAGWQGAHSSGSTPLQYTPGQANPFVLQPQGSEVTTQPPPPWGNLFTPAWQPGFPAAGAGMDPALMEVCICQ
jgi:hypothetical protein